MTILFKHLTPQRMVKFKLSGCNITSPLSMDGEGLDSDPTVKS